MVNLKLSNSGVQLQNFIKKRQFTSIAECITFLNEIGYTLEESYELSSELFGSKININTEGLKDEELFFVECLNGCKIIIEKKIKDSIFFIKNDKVLFEQDLKNEWFWCSYDDVWSVFETKYQWNDKQIQAFIKNMLEKHLGLGGYTPLNDFANFSYHVGKTSRIRGIYTSF